MPQDATRCHWMHTGCMQDACRMHAGCTQDAHMMHAGCTQDATRCHTVRTGTSIPAYAAHRSANDDEYHVEWCDLARTNATGCTQDATGCTQDATGCTQDATGCTQDATAAIWCRPMPPHWTAPDSQAHCSRVSGSPSDFVAAAALGNVLMILYPVPARQS